MRVFFTVLSQYFSSVATPNNTELHGLLYTHTRLFALMMR